MRHPRQSYRGARLGDGIRWPRKLTRVETQMKTLQALALVAALTGCASTTEDVLNSPPITIKSAKPANELAACAMQRIESMSPSISVRSDPPTKDGAVRFVTRIQTLGTLAVGLVEPRSSGSTLTFWFGKWIFATPEEAAADFTKGC